MKRESLGWFVAGAMIVLTCSLGAMQQGGQVGRYQLFEGNCRMITEKGNFDCPTVWRIDTVSGDTVRFFFLHENDKQHVGWVKILEPALETGPPR